MSFGHLRDLWSNQKFDLYSCWEFEAFRSFWLSSLRIIVLSIINLWLSTLKHQIDTIINHIWDMLTLHIYIRALCKLSYTLKVFKFVTRIQLYVCIMTSKKVLQSTSYFLHYFHLLLSPNYENWSNRMLEIL